APEIKSQLRPTPWNALWWDSIGQFWAWRTEGMRQIHYGRIPLWTNKVGCGFPFLANQQTQSLYPPALFGNWLFNRFGWSLTLPIRSARLMAWLALFHTLLALTGAYLLIRSYGISRLSSLIGASAYGLGSFQIAWALLPTLPATASWLPLTIWLLRKLMAAIADGNLKTATGFGIAFSLSLAMMLLAGHGQVAIYSLLALILFELLEFVPAYRKVKFVALLATILPFALSFLLASAQLLPTMELAPLTHRHSPPTWDGYRAFAERGLTIADWMTMALPFLFGNPIDGSYFGKESFADYCAYAGFGILVLAILGSFLLGRSLALPILQKRLNALVPTRMHAHTLALLHAHTPASSHSQTLAPLHAISLSLLGALLASGSTFNLPLYFLLPGFSQLGTPSRAVFLFQLAMGMMAAWAIDAGRGTRGEGRAKREAISAILAALVTLAFAVGYVGWLLSANLPNFSWSDWISLLAGQNIGIIAGFLAIIIFASSQSQVPSLKSPMPDAQSLILSPRFQTLRYAVALLLVGELVWFSAQQIPTARPSMVQKALQVAEQRLSELLKKVTAPKSPVPDPQSTVPKFPVPSPQSPLPIRILLIGGDWSLVRYPQSLLPPNSILLLLRSQVADARNYDSLLLRHHKAVMALFSNGNPCPLENGNMILMPANQTSLQGAKKLAQIVGAEAVIETFSERLQVAHIVSARLKPDEIVKPRAFVPQKVRYVQTASEAISQLPNLLEDTALIVAKPQKHRSAKGDHASVTVDKDAFVEVRVEALMTSRPRRPLWLVLSDTAYPGWKAFSPTGYSSWRELPIGIANGAFRACHVPDVFGRVVWVYFPSSFVIGMFLSCVGDFAVVSGVVVLLSRLPEKIPR
ncbi:MAG: hypothetical protein N3B10_10625, partial [Armatimonadetes bacterium]|nr:hypothetical protein [Armatimonadota bacterium]